MKIDLIFDYSIVFVYMRLNTETKIPIPPNVNTKEINLNLFQTQSQLYFHNASQAAETNPFVIVDSDNSHICIYNNDLEQIITMGESDKKDIYTKFNYKHNNITQVYQFNDILAIGFYRPEQEIQLYKMSEVNSDCIDHIDHIKLDVMKSIDAHTYNNGYGLFDTFYICDNSLVYEYNANKQYKLENGYEKYTNIIKYENLLYMNNTGNINIYQIEYNESCVESVTNILQINTGSIIQKLFNYLLVDDDLIDLDNDPYLSELESKEQLYSFNLSIKDAFIDIHKNKNITHCIYNVPTLLGNFKFVL